MAEQTQTTNNNMQIEASGRELTVTRTFAAPQSLVFEAFTDCKHLKHWWGPKGWSLPVCKMDFRPGGSWHYCMEGPNGEESWGLALYDEIDQPDRIVYRDYFSDAEGEVNSEMPSFQITMTFSSTEGGTQVISHTLVGSEAELQQLMEMGMVEGLTQTWDRLEELLTTLEK